MVQPLAVNIPNVAIYAVAAEIVIRAVEVVGALVVAIVVER